MNVNFIYIAEKELEKGFQNSIKSIIEDNHDLYFFVKLSKNKLDFVPLINNIQEIRLNKLKKKIYADLKLDELHNKIHFVFLDKPFGIKDFKNHFQDVKSIKLIATNNRVGEVMPILESEIDELQLIELKLN